jgi:hypothetical protein
VHPHFATVDIALQRGEVQGKVGSTWGSPNSGSSTHRVKNKIVAVLLGRTVTP